MNIKRKEKEIHRNIESRCNTIFYITLFTLEAILIISFQYLQYPDNDYGRPDFYIRPNPDLHYIAYHRFMEDCNTMMLIGFGFLVVFLRFHRWTSLGLTFFLSALVAQVYTLFFILWYRAFFGGFFGGYKITLIENIRAIKASIAMLIALGSLIGKVDTFQMLIIAFPFSIFYSLNESILFFRILARDIGGCIYIHSFAGIFGCCASWMYSPKSNSRNNPNLRANYASSTLTFIGTFFLWCLFPSFNSYNPLHSNQFYNTRFLSMVNTFLALTSSTISCFWVTMIFNRGKLNWFDVTNGTLAGGILISGCCDMFSGPVAPLIVGSIGGIISCLGFIFMTPVMESVNLFDTRGVFSLHVIPGFLGTIISCISCAFLDKSEFSKGADATRLQIELLGGRTGNTQALYQLLAYFVTSLLAFSSGLLSGTILRFWKVLNIPKDSFGDHVWWKMAEEEIHPSLLENLTTVHLNTFSQNERRPLEQNYQISKAI